MRPYWRRAERRGSKRYAHMIRRGRPCWDLIGGVCLRCAWLKATGRMARDHAAHIAHLRELETFAAPTSFRPLNVKRPPEHDLTIPANITLGTE